LPFFVGATSIILLTAPLVAAERFESRTVYRFRSFLGRVGDIHMSRAGALWDDATQDAGLLGGGAGCCLGLMVGQVASGDTIMDIPGTCIKPGFVIPCGAAGLGSVVVVLVADLVAGRTIAITQFKYRDDWITEDDLIGRVLSSRSINKCEAFLCSVSPKSRRYAEIAETLSVLKSAQDQRQDALARIRSGAPLSLSISADLLPPGGEIPTTKVVTLLSAAVRNSLPGVRVATHKTETEFALDVAYVESSSAYLVIQDTVACSGAALYRGGIGYVYGDDTLPAPTTVVRKRVVFGNVAWHKDAVERKWSTIAATLSRGTNVILHAVSNTDLPLLSSENLSDFEGWLAHCLLSSTE
jgi:hypothetical protein